MVWEAVRWGVRGRSRSKVSILHDGCPPLDRDEEVVDSVRALLQQPTRQPALPDAYLANISKDVQDLNLLQTISESLVQEVDDAAASTSAS